MTFKVVPLNNGLIQQLSSKPFFDYWVTPDNSVFAKLTGSGGILVVDASGSAISCARGTLSMADSIDSKQETTV